MRKNEYTKCINEIKATEKMKQSIKEKMLQQVNLLQQEKYQYEKYQLDKFQQEKAQQEKLQYEKHQQEIHQQEIQQQDKVQQQVKVQQQSKLNQMKLTIKEEKNRRTFWLRRPVRIVLAAIVVFIVVGLTGKMILDNQNLIPLEKSHGRVKVKYITNAPNIRVSNALVYLTEEELIQREGLEIVQGTITDIKNIEVIIEGDKNYYALASILVDKVYQGKSQVGDVIVIKLPCAIDTGVWVEDTGVVSAMRVGMRGIFMPFTYDEENSFYREGDTTLYWKDIVDYGLLDGERYVFLETSDGIQYSEYAYPSLQGANNLVDIESFLVKMLESKNETGK